MAAPRQIRNDDDMAIRNDAASGHFTELAHSLCEIGRNFYGRGWAPGTGGNYSIVSTRQPLQLAITASGMDKGSLLPSDILLIDERCEVIQGSHRPSYESLLHVAVVRARGAGAVLHTHSVPATILSQQYAAHGGLPIEGYEMLKGLDAVHSHQHREWVPILANSQDIPQLAAVVEKTLSEHSAAHGFLLQGHGLYTWGRNAAEARRHVEVFEFLFEVLCRTGATPGIMGS